MEKSLKFHKLKRRGCPVDRIPRFSGTTYYCESNDFDVYNLADGSKCCRKSTGSRKLKEKPFQTKPKLGGIKENPNDPTKIFNPRTKRWVKKTGKIGKEILAGYYK